MNIWGCEWFREFISPFPNNVRQMTGIAGIVVFESKEDIVSIPEDNRTNDLLFEEQNKKLEGFFFSWCNGEENLKYWRGGVAEDSK